MPRHGRARLNRAVRAFPSAHWAAEDLSWASTRPGLMRSGLQASAAFYPVSPFKIFRLIEEAADSLGGPTSLPVPRQQLYDAVSAKAPELAKRSETERESYAAGYAHWLRRRSTLKALAMVAAALRNLAFYILLTGTAWFYIARYSSEAPRVPRATAAVLAFSGVLAVSLWAVCYLSRRRVLAIGHSLRPAARDVDKRISHEFETIALDLIGASVQRRLDPLLRVTEAPTLIELESPRILPFQSFDEVMGSVRAHVTSAVGVAGRRGAGKTALLRWLGYALEPGWTGIYISTPAIYEISDFVRVIFDATARAILKEWSVLRIRRGPLTIILDQFRPISAADEIRRMSQAVLDSIAGAETRRRTARPGLGVKGLPVQRPRQISWTEPERGHAAWVAAYTRFLEEYRRLGGRPLVIAIDELDKLATTEEAISAVNGLKDLFHIPGTHFVVSLSEDALHRFAMRGVPFCDAFDSAFDTIVSIRPPSAEDACKMLSRRVDDFPTSAALFCYAWSGGLPRDLIRVARSCVELRRRYGRPVSVRNLAASVVRRDVRDTVDAAIARNLDSGRQDTMEALFAVRRRIEDNAAGLPPNAAEWVRAQHGAGALQAGERNEALHALQVYLTVASAISDFFANEPALAVAANIDQIFAVSADLARAKAALAVHFTEAEWIVAQARAKMGTLRAGQRV